MASRSYSITDLEKAERDLQVCLNRAQSGTATEHDRALLERTKAAIQEIQRDLKERGLLR